MECRDIFEKLGEYIDRELDDSICDEIDEHMKDCEPCIAFINTLRKTVELFKTEGAEQTNIPNPVSENLMNFLKKEIRSE